MDPTFRQQPLVAYLHTDAGGHQSFFTTATPTPHKRSVYFDQPVTPIDRTFVEEEAKAMIERGENRLQNLKEQMIQNLKNLKQTK